MYFVCIINKNAESCLLSVCVCGSVCLCAYDEYPHITPHKDDIDRFYCVTNNTNRHTHHNEVWLCECVCVW